VTPARNQATCEACREAIDATADGHAQYVSGWSVNRPKGTNGVALQERHPRWLCRFCLDKRRAGICDDQESLF
jgi:hypothetical protein